jgi:hypothetical protein
VIPPERDNKTKEATDVGAFLRKTDGQEDPRRANAGESRAQRHFGSASVAGRPGYETESRGLIAVRCGPPNGSSLIFEAIGTALWRFVNSRFDNWLSEIRQDGDTSYPCSTVYYGNVSKIFPPTGSRAKRASRPAVKALKARREVQYHHSATLAGRQGEHSTD